MAILGHNESHPQVGAEAWTRAEEQKAIEMFQNGYSTAEVARQLGRSHNAIHGRMYRIGFRRRVFDKPGKEPPRAVNKYAPMPDHGLCCWPLEKGEWCGRPAMEGKSYCQEHRAISLQETKKLDVSFWEMVARIG